MFTADNFEWVTNNVKKIAGEFHIAIPSQREKWIQFRDLYLRHFDNFQVLSLDYVDIKWDIWNDHFIEYYGAFMLFVDNREPSKPKKNLPVIPIHSIMTKKKWQHWPAPTM
jgi:hypothetical protein